MNGKLKRFKMGLLLASSSLVMLMAFNNCKGEGAIDLGSEASSSDGSYTGSMDEVTGTLCEQDIKRFYSRNWHNFTKTNCSSCHSNGPGKGRFANSNVNLAFDEFMMTGQDKIGKNATSPAHQPPATGTQHIQEVNSLKVEWMKALEQYAVCSGDPSVIPSEPQINKIAYFSIEQEIGALAENTPVDQLKTLTWDINADIFKIADPTNKLKIPGAGTISIQIGRYKNSNGNTFYSFFNPRLNGNSVDMNIVGLFIRMNGLLLSYPTTFNFIDVRLQDVNDKRPAATSEMISTGSIVAPKIISPTDRISLQFINIKREDLPNPPAPNAINFIVRELVNGNLVPSTAKSPYVKAPDITNATPQDKPLEVELEIGLARPAEDFVTATFSEVTDFCGVNYGLANDNLQSSMRRLAPAGAGACEPQLYSLICAGGRTDCAASTTRNEFTFMRARSILGTTFRRFDWDYMAESTSVTFSPGQQYAKVKVFLSTNIRRATVPATIPSSGTARGEANRILTFKLESVTGEGSLGTNLMGSVVVMKHNNPVPPEPILGQPSIPRYQDMMSASGVLQLNCVRCHNSDKMAGDYDMTNFELMVRNGVLKPRTAASQSEMFTRMSKDFGNLAKPMPQDGFMTSEKVDIVKRWIEAGAPNN